VLKKSLKLIGIAIFLWILFQIDLSKLLAEISKVNIPLLAASFLIIFAIYYVKMLRWHLLVKTTGLKISLMESWKLYNIGIFLAVITPAKLGELGRAAYLVKAGLDKRTSIGLAIVDRLYDVVITSVLILIAFGYLFGFEILLLAIPGSFLILVLTLLVNKKIKNFLPFLKSTLTLPVISKASLYTVANWIIYYIWAITVARSIGIDLPSLTLVLIFTIAGTIAVLPIAPSGLGTRDAALIWLLGFYSIPAEHAVALALLMFASNFLSGSLGAVYFLRGLSLAHFNHET